MKRPGPLAICVILGMVIVAAAAIVSQLDRKHPDPFTSARSGATGHLSYHLAVGVDPDLRDPEGLSLIHLALGEKGSYPAVALLVSSGASVTSPSADETPIGRAAAAGRLREVRLFLDQGVDPDGPDPLGRRPLHRIQGRGPAAMIVMELLRFGARLDLVDGSGRSAELHLRSLGDPAIERLLAEKAIPDPGWLRR